MCLTIPGKIIAIDNEQAIIDFGIARKKASNKFAKAKLNDYAIVKGNIIIETIPKKEARQIQKTFIKTIKNKKKKITN